VLEGLIAVPLGRARLLKFIEVHIHVVVFTLDVEPESLPLLACPLFGGVL